MINPYDLGEIQIVERVGKLKIDDLIRKVSLELKEKLIQSEIEVLGVPVLLTRSKTRFNGERLWFQCPICKLRKGTLFKSEREVGCRICLRLRYRKQRYKDMVELST